MSKFDKIIPKGSVPNCQLQIANRYDNRWFKCKLKPPKNPVLEQYMSLGADSVFHYYYRQQSNDIEVMFSEVFVPVFTVH